MESNWKRATDLHDETRDALFKQLEEAVAEANYATVAADAPISNPIAHRVLYAAWRYVQYAQKPQ